MDQKVKDFHKALNKLNISTKYVEKNVFNKILAEEMDKHPNDVNTTIYHVKKRFDAYVDDIIKRSKL